MAKLIYLTLASLDGYIADEHGNFEWAAPDDEVHEFVNELARPTGTYLYGRKMYETMVAWETMPTSDDEPVSKEFAEVWRAADKIVYSTTLEAASSDRTRIERDFDPEAIRALKAQADRDIGIGGGTGLAVHAIKSGLVDEYQLFLNPIVIGRGNQALPDDLRVALDLVDVRRFSSGVVYLHYRAAS